MKFFEHRNCKFEQGKCLYKKFIQNSINYEHVSNIVLMVKICIIFMEIDKNKQFHI